MASFLGTPPNVLEWTISLVLVPIVNHIWNSIDEQTNTAKVPYMCKIILAKV